MSALSAKIRKAREIRVEVADFVFTVLRPTFLEQQEKLREAPARAIPQFVIAWEGVKQSDLFPSGDPIPVEFDADACAEWLADRPDLLAKLADAMLTGIEARAKQLEDALGN